MSLTLQDIDRLAELDTLAGLPDGTLLAIARRYEDERFTRGAQVYLLDPEDGSVEALTEDARYANAFFSWDATGDRLVIQRFPCLIPRCCAAHI